MSANALPQIEPESLQPPTSDTEIVDLPTTEGPALTDMDEQPSGRLLIQRHRAESDHSLLSKATEDIRAREVMIERYMGLARRLADKYYRGERREPYDDLLQVACLGLIKAVDRFDTSTGVAFSSYAIPTIAGEIKRHYRDHTRSIHLTRSDLERSLKVNKAMNETQPRAAGSLAIEEVATKLGLTTNEVIEAIQAYESNNTISLDLSIQADNGDGLRVIDRIEAPMNTAETAISNASFWGRIKRLTQRDREIIIRRFIYDQPVAEVARRVGLSESSVARIIHSIYNAAEAEDASFASAAA